MESQTRQLLRTLADDLTDALLGELIKRREVLETDLQDQVAGSRQSISRRLAELEALGIVVGASHRTSGRGRPTRSWRIASPEITEFRHQADEVLLRLLEGQAERHRKAIRVSRPVAAVRQLRS